MKRSKNTYSIEFKNRVYDYWKKTGCTYTELAKEFGLPSYHSASGIVEWMMAARQREREKAATVRFHQTEGGETRMIVRPGWCWPENVRALHEHTGQGAEKEMPLLGWAEAS